MRYNPVGNDDTEMEMNQIDGDVLDRCDESKQVSAITKCGAIQSAMMVRAMALIPSVGEYWEVVCDRSIGCDQLIDGV